MLFSLCASRRFAVHGSQQCFGKEKATKCLHMFWFWLSHRRGQPRRVLLAQRALLNTPGEALVCCADGPVDLSPAAPDITLRRRIFSPPVRSHMSSWSALGMTMICIADFGVRQQIVNRRSKTIAVESTHFCAWHACMSTRVTNWSECPHCTVLYYLIIKLIFIVVSVVIHGGLFACMKAFVHAECAGAAAPFGA